MAAAAPLEAPKPKLKTRNNTLSPDRFAGNTKGKRLNKSFKDQHLVEEHSLTPAQLVVVEAIARGETPFAAAKIAGVNHPYVYTLLKRPYFKAHIAERQAAVAAAADMTRKKVVDGLLDGIAMAKMMAEPASMISGWREIGKMCGFYAPVEHKIKLDISGNVTMTRLTEMTDAELLEMIEKGNQAPAPQLLVDEA